ncbi:MAG: hypothetical protein U9O78_02135 [Patescibacteria group bacterium]|nr:hypothetical protein [Patescibacteria group bacterium]
MKQINLPHKKVKLAILFSLFFIFLVGFFSPTKAQDSRTIIAIPPRVGAEGMLRIKPGEKKQVSIRFQNASSKTIKVQSYIQDFVVKGDGSTPIPVRDTTSNRWSLASWMLITPNYHQVAPKQTVAMNVLIEVPENALPGGHYAMILHEPINETAKQLEKGLATGEAAAAIGQKIGTLFYVIVEGPINEEAYIRNFEFKKFQEFGPIPFSFKISNQSDIHISPRMNIDIFNMLGQKKESIEIESKNVFPLNNREFAGKWNKLWGFGLYKAKLSMSYGEVGNVAVASTNFWIVPVRIILVIMLAILITAAAVAAVKRHIEYRYLEEEAKIKELQKKVKQYEQEDKKE